MLVTMLSVWGAEGSPRYSSMDANQSIAYISGELIHQWPITTIVLTVSRHWCSGSETSLHNHVHRYRRILRPRFYI